MRYRFRSVACLAVVVALVIDGRTVVGTAGSLPDRLSDSEFWRLSGELSEPNGYFRSDNLLSNEIFYPEVLDDLRRFVSPGGVYLGVGPEQNFNYIVTIRPRMVFITDIRRGNLHTQLMYKALFEMSKDRADFVSKLFTKPRPTGLTNRSSADEIMTAYWNVNTLDAAAFRQNLQALKDHLTKRAHKLPLPREDLDGIEYVYYNFYWFGPSIMYSSSPTSGGRGSNMANYAELMRAADAQGTIRSYLGTEEGFQFIRDLESRNLIVPVVGNFGGPHALRAVGQYVRERGAVVSAFYLSNVEQYLHQDGLWTAFCANVASMPLNDSSTFIRSGQGGFGGGGRGLRNTLGSMMAQTQGCAVSR